MLSGSGRSCSFEIVLGLSLPEAKERGSSGGGEEGVPEIGGRVFVCY